ncbi:hypothetical protein [Pedobacter sp.]|uniref:hypothetical protein n=1 Tax=Pedobacter sp. TaxID=1411316 RepID=UPI0031D0E290
MRRLIIIFICSVFAVYSLVFLSAFVHKLIPGPLKSAFQQARVFVGLGALFVNESSMRIYATSYRFYQDGKWSDWQFLEGPLFEEYISKGRLASLKHNRLDKLLCQKIIDLRRKSGDVKTKESKEFKAFTSHLFYRHNQNRKPDSLEVKFQQKFREPDVVKTVFKIKYQP